MPYKDPRRAAEYQRTYYESRKNDPAYRAVQRAATRKWLLANPGAMKRAYRKWDLKTSYGLTEEDVRIMYENQEGLCGVCSRHMCRCGLKRGKCPTQAEIDHDHTKSGRESVRGLVCTTCNMGMGSLKDSPRLLTNAADYLETGRSPWVN